MQSILTYIVVAIALFYCVSSAVKALRKIGGKEPAESECGGCDGCDLYSICKEQEKKNADS